MTKKLFVVLVVVTAMLITFSLVLAAKKAPREKVGLPLEKFQYQDKQTVMPAIKAPVEPQQAMVLPGVRAGFTVPVEGTATPLTPYDKTDLCDMWGFPAYYWTGWIWGLEMWANYQDPYQFEYGCVDVFPCSVLTIQFDVRNPDTLNNVYMEIRPIVLANVGTDCPFPGDEVCAGPVGQIDLPPGWWTIYLPLDPGCCMYEPYFAGVEILTDHSAAPLDHIAGNDGLPCQSYNYYGGWYDCVVDYGGPGMILLSSIVLTRQQNLCEEVPFCCQFGDSCNYLTPTECLNAGGTPAPDLRYECMDGVCKLPWEVDTCKVESVLPPLVRLLAGETAEYEVTVSYVGEQDTCYLTIDPDPPCPNCVASFDPNPVQSPATTSTLTIVTDPTTSVGTYTFDVGGAKASAALEVVEPSDTCEMFRDNESWAYFWSGWVVGDQQVVYFDPDELCPGCDVDVYPFYVEAIKGIFYSHQGAPFMDYIFRIYNSTGDPCDGPQEELLSWEVLNVDTWWTWLTFPLPEVLCVDGPFFFALEFNYDPGLYFPCALWTDQPYLGGCTQFVYHDDVYTAWEDFWTDPHGYMSIRALGTCVSDLCPITCDMQQDNGAFAYITAGFEEGDQCVKYYDPEDYCDPVVYPYKIHDLNFFLYDFAGGWEEIDIAVRVYLECQDSCDGPGTPIYESDPITITDFAWTMAHVDLDELICVYEPFFIGIEYLEGIPDTTPSLVFTDETPNFVDSCHVWFYKTVVDQWIEHWNFWESPDVVGYPVIRVSGFTNHPECNPPPCDTTIELLPGGWAYYFWKMPPNDSLINMRFDMPIDHGGRLEYFEVALYEHHPEELDWGTPDPSFYVWLSDGMFPLDNNPPYQAIFEHQIPYDSIVWYSGLNTIQTYSHAIEFDAGESFHIGFSHAFEPNDTLSGLSDDGSMESDRASGWYQGAWEPYYPYEFIINAYICPYAAEESTFTMRCSPALGYATPGDPPVNVYQVNIAQILGYDLPVTLSLASVTPAADITVAFDPNGVNCPFISDVACSVGVGVSYGDYVLEFLATGSDGQTQSCDVTLRVQPPYDDDLVDFYHGKQRMTNFGAVGDHDHSAESFLCYGITNLLFDGTFIVATGPDAMALDFGRTHFHTGFVPSAHQTITLDPAWPANIGEAEFYTDTAVIPIFENDHLYVIGIMDSCVDFSLKIKIYTNTGLDPITDMYIAMLEDWDFGDAYNNWGNLDYEHSLVWMYEPLDSSIICGLFKAPFYDDTMFNVQLVHNAYITWPNEGYGLDPDSVWRLLTTPGPQEATYVGADSQDYSVMITAPPMTLYPESSHIEIWIDFCFLTSGADFADPSVRSVWWHRVLRYAGFYRGDVDASDTLEIPQLDISDLVYLINYLFLNGPEPLPYADQGDVNADGIVNIGDVVHLLNYVFINGPPPIDCVRFIPCDPGDPKQGPCWCRESLFENDNWK